MGQQRYILALGEGQLSASRSDCFTQWKERQYQLKTVLCCPHILH
jgi:hypothetical protein